MMARKPGSRSKPGSRRRAAAPPPGRLRTVQRPKPEARDGAEPGHAGNDPDQMPGRDEIDQQPACQRADDEGRRAPQPQRPVIEAVPRHAAQRIGVRQRHHRRPHAGGDGEGEEYQQRLMLGADHRESERGRKGRDDHRAAQRLTPFGQAGHERQDRKSRHGRHRRDDPDPRGIDPDRLQPHREERQIGAAEPEQRAVKQRQPRRESPGLVPRCDGDL